MFHECTKHIDNDMTLYARCNYDGYHSTFLCYVSPKTHLADIFTKALEKSQFVLLLSKLGILDTSHAQLDVGC